MIGILCTPLTRSLLPVTAFGFKKDVWLISSDSVYYNGQKVNRINYKFYVIEFIYVVIRKLNFIKNID